MKQAEQGNELRAASIGSGELLQLTNEAIGEIAQDIAAREDIKGKRTINVKIEFLPKGSHIAVGYTVETKMPKDAVRTGLAFVDAEGRMVTELRKQQKLPMELVDRKEMAAGK